MAKRGRKKNFNINNFNNKDELIGMVINQINSLNKKMKAFARKGYDAHIEYMSNLLNGQVQYTMNETISKSKSYLGEKNLLQLKKLYVSLQHMNNHNILGTIKKYESAVTRQVEDTKKYARDFLVSKGYDNNFILKVINDKNFYTSLFSAFDDDGTFTSDQIIEEVALNYDISNINATRKKRLEELESGRMEQERIDREQKAFEEWQRQNNMR